MDTGPVSTTCRRVRPECRTPGAASTSSSPSADPPERCRTVACEVPRPRASSYRIERPAEVRRRVPTRASATVDAGRQSAQVRAQGLVNVVTDRRGRATWSSRRARRTDRAQDVVDPESYQALGYAGRRTERMVAGEPEWACAAVDARRRRVGASGSPTPRVGWAAEDGEADHGDEDARPRRPRSSGGNRSWREASEGGAVRAPGAGAPRGRRSTGRRDPASR